MIRITHFDNKQLVANGERIEVYADFRFTAITLTYRESDQLLCELLASRLARQDSHNLVSAYNELSRSLAMPELPAGAAVHPAGSALPKVARPARVRSRWS